MFSLGEGSFGFLVRNNIFLTSSIVIALSIVISCNNNDPEQKNLKTRLPVSTSKTKLDCLDGRDTTFSNNDFLRFVTLGDTAFDLQVGIGGKEALLGYQFGCNGPKGLIPKVLKHTANEIILVRGYGFHYREVVVCSSRAGIIYVQRFESELAIGAKFDIAYPDTNDPSRIVVLNLLTNKVVILAMRQSLDSIRHFQITENSVVVVYDKGQELVLPFKR